MLSININSKVKIVFHKTYEICSLIQPEKAELIVTMNITRSMLKSIADKKKTICYFVSCYKDIKDLVKERFFLASCHLKLYQTASKIIFSTANLSLSSFDEISIVLDRTEELDRFVNEIVQNLKKTNDFVKAFH